MGARLPLTFRSPDFSLLSRPHPPVRLSPSSLHIGLVSQDWVDQYKEKFLLAGTRGRPQQKNRKRARLLSRCPEGSPKRTAQLVMMSASSPPGVRSYLLPVQLGQMSCPASSGPSKLVHGGSPSLPPLGLSSHL